MVSMLRLWRVYAIPSLAMAMALLFPFLAACPLNFNSSPAGLRDRFRDPNDVCLFHAYTSPSHRVAMNGAWSLDLLWSMAGIAASLATKSGRSASKDQHIPLQPSPFEEPCIAQVARTVAAFVLTEYLQDGHVDQGLSRFYRSRLHDANIATMKEDGRA